MNALLTMIHQWDKICFQSLSTSYSASQYPHLANKGEVIYSATPNEHFKGWHGGNWKNSLPGKPINSIDDF